ncbi:MAG: cytochrome c oxidase subunit II [Anaerolineae bacterium]
MFVPESPLAQPIAVLFITLLAIGAGILLLIIGLVVFAGVRFRARAGDEEEPRQDFGRLPLEIGWTAAPLLLVLGLLVWTGVVMARSDPPHPTNTSNPDLVIIAHQWWWEYRYPKSNVLTANEMHMPTGVRWLVQVESADVIHSWWVPSLGRKMDAIPGHPNYLWLQIDQTGEYHGTCSEFCGAEHAWMRILVVAQSPADFEAWQQQQLAEPNIPAGSEAAKGEQLFRDLPCINCHLLTDAGPNLSHVGSRQTLGAGVLTNTPENLTKWLADTQAVKPGIHMPNMNLSQDQIQALVAYLEASK